jgi:hypothetical protein
LMASSGEASKPAWSPQREKAQSLRENLRGIKDFDPSAATASAPPFEQRPELYVGAAFAGGLLLAGLLRWLSR